MKSVAPHELAPQRAFFTEFDRYTDLSRWAVQSEREAVARLLERKLKLYLLTKAHVVVAASQLLESPFAHRLILDHPGLVSSGAVISSIKVGHDSSAEFLRVKRDEDKDRPRSQYHSVEALEVAQLIDSSGVSVRWQLATMSDWFRERLADDLADERSLVRIALWREGVIPPVDLIEQIRSQRDLSRGTVEQLVAKIGVPQLSAVMRLYADFIYYLSGARATNSEGVLPQENLVDYSLGELIGRRSSLSDHEVFCKIFLDVVKARSRTRFPDEFLDAVTISDALELRQVALSKRFVQTYEAIQTRAKEAMAIRDSERLVLLLSELDEYEAKLHTEFETALQKELPTRLVEKRQRAAGRVLQAVSSVVVPAADVKEIVVSGLEWIGFEKAAASIDSRIKKGFQAFEGVLENMDLLERQVLLDFVDRMKAKYIEKLTVPEA